MTWINVSKRQFDAFVKAYPRPLTSNVSGICEPPQRTLYDFSGKDSNCMNACVACEVRHWLSPDGEIDDANHGKFWTYAIQDNSRKADIAKRVAETCERIGIDLKPQ